MIYLPLEPGMLVKRGPDWKWEDQDGGIGGVGIVIEVKSWKTELNKGARIRWQSGQMNVYRYGAENAYDVKLYNNIIYIFI